MQVAWNPEIAKLHFTTEKIKAEKMVSAENNAQRAHELEKMKQGEEAKENEMERQIKIKEKENERQIKAEDKEMERQQNAKQKEMQRDQEVKEKEAARERKKKQIEHKHELDKTRLQYELKNTPLLPAAKRKKSNVGVVPAAKRKKPTKQKKPQTPEQIEYNRKRRERYAAEKEKNKQNAAQDL